MTRTPTGRLERVGDRLTLFVTRTFQAPIEDVWAAITEPPGLTSASAASMVVGNSAIETWSRIASSTCSSVVSSWLASGVA